MPSLTDRLNMALAGRYRIVRHLGEGGMASVYLCEDLKHDRKVALKLLKPELAAVLGGERFVVEIKTTASLQHPHILPLFDSGTADGFLFYVMPFIEGETLRGKLDRERQLGVDEAVRIAREVLDALGYAHERGIVHRDVKPENILLHGGHAMVADFGIALAVSAAAGGRMTETGLSLGTPHYMSPEQATAEKEITARSDIYSLASVLYEMLAGQPPHIGGSAQQVIMKIIAEPVAEVTTLRKSVPANVAAALDKALEKLPADRFESARAFGEALVEPGYTAGLGARRSALGKGDTHNDGFKRAFIGASLVAAALAGTTLWGWFRAPPAVVTRQRIVIWENQQIPPDRLMRGLAISPDGGTIVYVDGVGANSQLYAKERDRVDPTAIAGTAEVLGAPTFSPDGEWIAFVTREGKIKKVPRSGGSATTLADSSSTFRRSIAWLEGGTLLFVDARLGVRAVSENGGAPRQVVVSGAPDTAGRAISGIVGLPGGQAALIQACTRVGCFAGDLRVLDLRTGKMKVLASDGMLGWPLPGGIVVYLRKDGGVLAAPFDLHSLSFTKPPTPVLDKVRRGTVPDMAVSASGTIIYVSGGTGGADLQPVWVTRTGVATPIDTAWTMQLTPVFGRGLSLSRDGRRLAVTAMAPGATTRHDIWIKSLDDGPLSRLTFDGENINPVWTADGHWVEFVCIAVCRRRADGTGAIDTLVVYPRGILEVVALRDSDQFLVRLPNPPSRDIVLGRRGDTTMKPVVASPTYDETAPALSADGRWLAYASNESGRYEVYVRPYPKVNAGRWQVSQAGGMSPVWAPSGRELFFRNDIGQLIAVSVATAGTITLGAQSMLFDVSRYAGDEVGLYYDVSPDGKRFVLLRPIGATGPTGPDKLIEVVNWGAEVRAKLAGKGTK